MNAAIAAAREPLRLPGRAESVARARRFVIHQLTASRVAEPLIETAALLVSEIVTNAVVHVGGEVVLLVDAPLAHCALVEVCDHSPVEPTLRRRDLDATTGRGLALVEALASSHGTARRAGGKVVWFTVGDPAGLPVPEVQVVPPSPDDAPAASEVTVLLMGLPIDHYTSMRQHNEALLREYQLHVVSGFDTSPCRETAPRELEDALADLTSASSARAAVGNAVLRAVDAAVDTVESPGSPGSTGSTGERRVNVTVRVMREDVAPLRRLPALLDAAEWLAEHNMFLAPPAEPGMVALRNWLYGEVVRQAEGRSASAWEAV